MRHARWAAAILLVCVVVLMLPASALAFPDVATTHPYHAAIEELAAQGIVAGHEDGSFGPQDPVVRAQFAKMIVLTLGMPQEVGEDYWPNSSVPFVDLGPDDLTSLCPHEYVALCAVTNITRGTDRTHFSPWLSISRAQVVTMVVRAAEAAGLEPGIPGTPPEGYLSVLGDFDFIHGRTMAKAQFNGLLEDLQGYGRDWNPWAEMTRGEVAQVLFNLLKLLEDEEPEADLVPVVSVVDGDTIRVIWQGREEAVRLIGFDTPESGEPFAADATSYLRDLVGGRQVRLEFDVEERDLYGRLLAYAWTGSTMANTEMLRAGLATLFTYPPNVKYTDLFTSAENEARQAGRGIWGAPAGCPLEITNIHPDAAGNDNYNLNDEWIEFRVLVSGSLIGYSVEDAAGHAYSFPDRIFQKGQIFKLRTGSGADTQTDLYWGASGSAIWNNSGDTIKVLDAQGHILLTLTY